MAKVKPIFTMYGGSVSEIVSDDDMRLWDLGTACVGRLDARGKKLTLQFVLNATFGELLYDETTQMYNDEGQRLDGFRVVEAGGMFQFQGVDNE